MSASTPSGPGGPGRGGPSRRFGMCFSKRTATARHSWQSSACGGPAAGFLRAALVAGAGACLLAGQGVPVGTRGEIAEAPGERARYRPSSHFLRPNHASTGFHESQTRTSNAGDGGLRPALCRLHARRFSGRPRQVAKDVAPEAHRRFRADLRAKQERDSERRAADLALHEEKQQFVAEWIAANGTEEQRIRQAAGVLPMSEAVAAITEQVFARVGRPQYTRDGAQRLREHLAHFPEHAGVEVTAADVVVSTEHAKMASAAQWAVVEEFKADFPDAAVVLLGIESD